MTIKEIHHPVLSHGKQTMTDIDEVFFPFDRRISKTTTMDTYNFLIF
jgi:hypothetical protein